MNPAGDYCKKELSPALRNRFTELYVSSCFDQPELNIYLESQGQDYPEEAIADLDMFRVIHQNLDNKAYSLPLFKVCT